MSRRLHQIVTDEAAPKVMLDPGELTAIIKRLVAQAIATQSEPGLTSAGGVRQLPRRSSQWLCQHLRRDRGRRS